MPYVEPWPGQRLFYTDEGQGAPVLLIHGWSCDGTDWSWLADDLRADHRVIIIDNRGHGHSSPVDGHYAPREFAADAAALLEHLDLGPVDVIGHSMGTIIASALAVERPDLVRSMLLIDPVYGSDGAQLQPMLEALRHAPHAVAQAGFASFYVEKSPSWLRAWHRHRIVRTPEEVVRDALIGLYEGDGGIGRRELSETYLPRRRAPILAIYAGSRADSALWERGLAHDGDIEIEVWDGHGHFLHQEDPERFAAVTRDWLAKVKNRMVPTN